MATFRSKGSSAFNTGAGGTISPGLPTGYKTGDILVVIVETSIGDTISISNWTQADNSPSNSFDGASNDCTLHVYWRRATGDANDNCSINISDTNHAVAQIAAFYGCRSSGDPFDTTAKSNDSTYNTTYSTSSIITSRDGELVLIAVADGYDNSTVGGFSITNTSLTGIGYADNLESGTSAGDGGAIAMGYGTKTNAGTVSATTGSTPHNSNNYDATWTAAFLPPGQDFTISESLSTTESITNLRGLQSTISETLGISETWTALKGILFTISETITTSEVWTTTRTLISTIIDTLGLVELSASVEKKWNNLTKNISTWSNSTKNTSTFTNQTKNTSNWDNQNKN